MRVTLSEAKTFAEAATPADGPGRLLVQLITPGWGSSGFYSEAVIEAAAKDRVFPAGTHMYIDHPSESENYDRPERTVKDLAAVLLEDARWDADRKALVAEVRVFSQWRRPLAEMAEAIGTSIRGTAEGEMGEAEGRRGQVFTRLVEGMSVDFVTHAGRGGKVLQIIESARPVREARNVGQWVESRIHRDFTVLADDMAAEGRLTREERITLSGAIGDGLAAFVARVEADAPQLYERDLWDEPIGTVRAATEAARRRGVTEATVNDRREQLQTLIKDEYGSDDTWPWVRDFDDTTVWFDTGGGGDGGVYQQGYEVTDDVATALTGDRTEVRVQTQYVPVGESAVTPPAAETAPTNVPVDPAGQSTTQESEEDTMPQIEEARLRQLEEAHGRVPALESERDAAVKRATEAEQRALQAEAGTYARDFARNLVTKANGDLAEASVARIVRDALRDELPLTEAGRLDTEAFTPAVEKARQEEETYLGQVAEASGVGAVRGVGATTTTDKPVSEADVDKAIAGAFGRKGA